MRRLHLPKRRDPMQELAMTICDIGAKQADALERAQTDNRRMRQCLLGLESAFAHEGDIHFYAQPVAYWRDQIKQALGAIPDTEHG